LLDHDLGEMLHQVEIASQREADAVAVYVPTKMSERDAVCNSALT